MNACMKRKQLKKLKEHHQVAKICFDPSVSEACDQNQNQFQCWVMFTNLQQNPHLHLATSDVNFAGAQQSSRDNYPHPFQSSVTTCYSLHQSAGRLGA